MAAKPHKNYKCSLKKAIITMNTISGQPISTQTVAGAYKEQRATPPAKTVLTRIISIVHVLHLNPQRCESLQP